MNNGYIYLHGNFIPNLKLCCKPYTASSKRNVIGCSKMEEPSQKLIFFIILVRYNPSLSIQLTADSC